MKNAISTCKFSFYGIVCFLVALSMLFTPFVSANLRDVLSYIILTMRGKAHSLQTRAVTDTMVKFPTRIGLMDRWGRLSDLAAKAATRSSPLKARMS